ncbi:Uncharacterised protein [Mycobacteroides abscessus subsp. abscessus]|nr:Uncharacterised protein [Mycobacteroides abscessus subsp. abscessus]
MVGAPPANGHSSSRGYTGSTWTWSVKEAIVSPQLSPNRLSPGTTFSKIRAAISPTMSTAVRPGGRTTTWADCSENRSISAASSSASLVRERSWWMRISTMPRSRADSRVRETLERDTPRALAISPWDLPSR